MASPIIRIPLQKFPRRGCAAYRIEFDLEFRNQEGRFRHAPCRLDSAADFSIIPIWIATALKIPFLPRNPVYANTAAGKATRPSYFQPASFGLLGLPDWRFQSMFLFSPYPLKTALFALSDLVPNFLVRSCKATPTLPDGSVVLQLRQDHTGQRRR